MLGENKNLNSQKDSIKDTSNMPAPYQSEGFNSASVILTYTKTNKLITALYMVTDIMEKEEPLRIKLRTLGANIISDIHHLPAEANKRILATLSLLDIALAMNLISEMNSNILKKEFNELKKSIKELNAQGNPVWLEEFMKEEFPPLLDKEGAGGGNYNHHLALKGTPPQKGGDNPKGHTRIGIQKGSTLLKAITDRIPNSNFDALKKQRREEILKIVKTYSSTGGATITDIRQKASGALASCGEKTLQRELVSMVKDTVLKKFGEKRWSRYSI